MSDSSIENPTVPYLFSKGNTVPFTIWCDLPFSMNLDTVSDSASVDLCDPVCIPVRICEPLRTHMVSCRM